MWKLAKNQGQDFSNFSPLTPAVFHIFLAVSGSEQHGYHIMQIVEADTNGQFRMGPGTFHGTIKRKLKDGLIEESGGRPDHALDDECRRYYRLTDLGGKLLKQRQYAWKIWY